MTGPRKLLTIEEYNLQQEKKKKYQREKRREYMRKYVEEHRKENTIYNNAHNTLNNHITSGVITRQPCEVCGDLDTEAHHKDYNHPLDVSWLCKKHHAEWHRKNKPIYAK